MAHPKAPAIKKKADPITQRRYVVRNLYSFRKPFILLDLSVNLAIRPGTVKSILGAGIGE